LRYVKQRDKCVLFLEDVFGTTIHPQKLRDAGFEVECFAEVFTLDGKRPEDGVKDPRIIKHCHVNRRILVTMDKNIRYTHVEEIKKTTIGIIATESNRSEAGVGVWVEALIKAKPEIERKLKKHPLPWCARLSRTGKLAGIETITPEKVTRRTRPKEKESQPQREA
jgi:hypothetical protein